MIFRRQTFRSFAAAILVCVTASSAFPVNLPMTAFWAQRKITSGKFPIHSACMMPPQANLTRIGMKGGEGMTKESQAWAVALENMVESHLKSDGISINSVSNPLSSGASDEEIRGVILQIDQKYSSILPLIRKKPGGVEKSAYTLGDQVGMLPCSENSDILVFVQGAGQTVTQSRSTMTLLIGGPVEDAVLFMTIADAKTGEVVAFIQVYPTDASLLEVEAAFGPKLPAACGHEPRLGPEACRRAQALDASYSLTDRLREPAKASVSDKRTDQITGMVRTCEWWASSSVD